MANDGWHDIDYDFGVDNVLNEEISGILNEACHVFRLHADGNWNEIYKPRYARQLADKIAVRPSLIRKLLKLKDPVVSNITYAAIAVNKQADRITPVSESE